MEINITEILSKLTEEVKDFDKKKLETATKEIEGAIKTAVEDLEKGHTAAIEELKTANAEFETSLTAAKEELEDFKKSMETTVGADELKPEPGVNYVYVDPTNPTGKGE